MSTDHLNSQEDPNGLALMPRMQADGAWKRVLDRWFHPFLLCFWPAIAKQINWAIPPEDLGQELHSFTTESLVGKQIVDKLYQVQLKNKQAYLLLIHVEIQGEKEVNFSKRLFEYWYKIYDRYQLPVTTLVVLSDTHKNWRPKPLFINALGETELHYRFGQVKLLDYQGQEAQLLESSNPFHQLIAIYLEAKRTQRSPNLRYQVKVTLAQHLFNQGWERDDMISFYTFLDGVMRLPDSLEIEYNTTM